MAAGAPPDSLDPHSVRRSKASGGATLLGSCVPTVQEPAACLPNDDNTQKDQSYDEHSENDVAPLFRDRLLRGEGKNGGEHVHRQRILARRRSVDASSRLVKRERALEKLRPNDGFGQCGHTLRIP